ncbi:dockerin type I repeat-containing protein [Ruminococcus flavefaciens]|uniref:dockerin type I repeat-containing protein n=1 Tax=Ruminococcus flavefaciens TaxID=1265 RepID=UPI00048CA300|nr:dockerin type I repeat-containing protein [Ruminococcus flavefaciens]
MKLKRILSALTAAAIAVPCMCIPSVSAISSQNSSTATHEEPLTYIPDFPEEILKEFDINWTGLASNVFCDNTTFATDFSYNEFLYDGGYALYCTQSFGNYLGYVFRWHDCNSYKAYQSADFPLSDYTENMNLRLNLHLDTEIKESGDFYLGPLLELNDEQDELFIIEQFSAESVFPQNELIGSYTADGKEYDLYKQERSFKDISPMRYYAVNKGGLRNEVAPDEHPHEEYSLSVSEHLTNLKSIAGTDIRLNKYGILCEGNGGIGFGFYNASLSNDFYPLPEEKLSFNENGDPVTYQNELMKNLDGYRYSLQTSDSGYPYTQDEVGRYHITSHENNSFITPKRNGTLSATVSDGIFGTVSSGKEFDGKTPLLAKDYRLDYEYSVKKSEPTEIADDEEEVYDSSPAAAASVWTIEPYVKLNYQESTNIDKECIHYFGTVETDGEIYDIYQTDVYEMDMEPLGFDDKQDFNSYLFVHVNKEENISKEVKKGSFPITKLVKAAKAYGIEVGNIARIDLNIHLRGEYTMDILKNDITVNEFSPTEPDNNSSIYVDVSKSSNVVKIDPYTFKAITTGYMYGYENGCFSAYSNGSHEAEYTAGIQKSNDGRHRLDPDKVTKAYYKIEKEFNECYQVNYKITSEYNSIYKTINIIENSKNYAIEWNLGSYMVGMLRSPEEPAPELIKTYTSGGHTYDLYKESVAYSGCFNTNYYDTYVSVRQDQEEGDVLEGCIDFQDHLNKIEEGIIDKLNVSSISLEVSAVNEIGSVKALKNDIFFDTLDVPWTIVGDFNDDLCVDSLDVVAAKKALLSEKSEENSYYPAYKDINRNGTFDIADIVMLQEYVLGKIKSFPDIY